MTVAFPCLETPPRSQETAPDAPRRIAVTVVIPTKNEAANLPWVLRRIPDWVDEVIVVDGRSTDGTIDVARACRPDVVIVEERRPGKGAAVRAGFAAATGDVVAMLDADGSMDPQELRAFVSAVAEGAGLAKGSRRIAGGGSADFTRIRELGNRGLLLVSNVLLRKGFSELCYGYMALRRDVLPHLALRSDGFEIETEIVARAVRCGLEVAEVPSFEFPRRNGASNLNAVRDGLRIVATLLRVCTGRGSRVPAARQPFSHPSNRSAPAGAATGLSRIR